MWLLLSEKGELFHVTPGTEHVVGRKDGAIILNSDQSISRVHAKLRLKSNDANAADGIIVTDQKSKYGTFVNEGIESSTRIESLKGIEIKHQDVIRFGLQWNTWRVVYMPLVTLSSMINKQEKSILKTQIHKLGGQFMSNWSPTCTHLTMCQISLTVKVVCALAAGQHVVTPKYWCDLLKAVEDKRSSLPNPDQFVPPLNEATLNESNVSFLVNKNRASLFKGMLFVTTSQRQKSYVEPMVNAAGGRVVDFSDCKLRKEDFCKENVILMQTSSITSPGSEESVVLPGYREYSEYISAKKLRCIPESDIGLAVVFCSRENFCNPNYRYKNVFERHPAPQLQSEVSNIIVPETEETSEAVGPVASGQVINETINTTVILSGRPNKRTFKEDEEQERPFKKPSVMEEVKKGEIKCANFSKIEKITILEKDALKEKTDKEIDDGLSKSDKNTDVSKTADDNIVGFTSPPPSVDIFATVRSSGIVEQKNVAEESNHFEQKSSSVASTVFSKRSVDIFGTYNSNNKKTQNEEEGVEFVNSKVNKQKSKDNVNNNDDDDGFCFVSSKNKLSEKQNSDDISLSNKKRKINTIVDDDDDGFSFVSSKSKTVCNESKICDNKNNNDKAKKKKICHEEEDMDNDEGFSFVSSKTSTVTKRSKVCKSDSSDEGNNSIFKNVHKKDSTSKRKQVSNNDCEDYFEFKKSKTKVDENTKESCKNIDQLQDTKDPFQSSAAVHKSSEGVSNISAVKIKRSTSMEDSEDMFCSNRSRDVGNKIQENGFKELFCDDNLIKQIKKEPREYVIMDEELHDSTVVIVKSLIAPMRNITISKTSINKAPNFKKFKKVTSLKMPAFIDLVLCNLEESTSCKGSTKSSRYLDMCDSDEDIDEPDDNIGWSYKNTQTLNKKKIKNKK